MYILEGNIGAGKTTFLQLLDKHLPYVCITLEPVNNWQSQVYGQSLLANFYQDPKRWAYTLETLAMICRVREHTSEQNNEYSCRIIERSVYSGHYCFAHNGHDSGFMTESEWYAYNQWFNFLVASKCQTPAGFIYLKVDPEIAYERIKKRNRHAEKKISLAYLKQINARHEEFLVNKSNVLPELKKVPVLTLDGNKEFEKNGTRLKEHLDEVQLFMHKTRVIPAVKTGKSQMTTSE